MQDPYLKLFNNIFSEVLRQVVHPNTDKMLKNQSQEKRVFNVNAD